MSTEATNNYAVAFRAMRSRAHEPAWLSDLRARSFELFARTGLPTVKEEEWKYTNIAQIEKTSWQPMIELDRGRRISEPELTAWTYEEARDSRLVFVNGVFRQDLSTTGGIADELVALDFATALQTPQYEDTIRRSLEK